MALLDATDAIIGSIFLVLVRYMMTNDNRLGLMFYTIVCCIIVANHTIEYVAIWLITVFKTKRVRNEECGL